MIIAYLVGHPSVKDLGSVSCMAHQLRSESLTTAVRWFALIILRHRPERISSADFTWRASFIVHHHVNHMAIFIL